MVDIAVVHLGQLVDLCRHTMRLCGILAGLPTYRCLQYTTSGGTTKDALAHDKFAQNKNTLETLRDSSW